MREPIYGDYLPANPVKKKKASTPAPTSGAIPNFTPSVVMPTPKVQPGQPGFVGPVAPTPKLTLAQVKTNLAALEKESTDATAAINAAVAEAEAAGKAGDAAVEEARLAAEKAKGVPAGTFEPVGKLLRYDVGKTPGSRIPVYADGLGGEFKGEEIPNPVIPGSTGFSDTSFKESTTVTLASSTFANTVALLMGENEAGQPWVEELRQLAQGFINTGSDTDEAMNLALRDAKEKGKASKFVQRFDAIFKLQDRLNKGETVQVPTIADYVKSEIALGDVFRNVGLGELATQGVMSKVFGDANKSVAEATAIISDIFGAIDNAPAALKADLQVLAPGADRTAIAKALLLGKDGIDALTKKVASISQVSAAKSQGIILDESTAVDLAAGGATYGTSLDKFATVKQLERGQALGRMSNIGFTQQDAIASTFQSSAAADEKIRRITEEEQNRYAAKSGRLASQNRSTAGQV
jgi:hypothetical protein